MTSPAHFLRLCLRPSRRVPNLRAAAIQQSILRRPLSTTQWRSAAADDSANKNEVQEEIDEEFGNPGEFLRKFLRDESITEEERGLATRMLEDWRQVPPNKQAQFDRLTTEVNEASADLRRPVRAKRNSFWNAEEVDSDLITDEIGEDDFEEDDMMAMGHAKLEEHREFREYARIAVWEMPLLSKLAKPFQPPTQEEILRFRYTTYLGEFHPADRKVVVEFCPTDMPGLTAAQQLKLKKLAGPRYNPEKDIIKMSCERFEHQAQNKRYLGDLVDKMVATAKDPTDMFEDLPLDTRHHKFKPKLKFPRDWYLTEQRKTQLEAQRKQALLLDEEKRTEGALIDGVDTIQQALLAAKVEEPVPVLRGRLIRGRR
ncbi:mitochondrial ribosomal subunit protein-domain-containing protein [Chaetomium fimeti]|uniref:Small ribosomal subunit protein mS35 n=1 Tax=Chaetomium fimeti TaxID=1854472 RepID=A0AAE0HEP6_9PEZI|nr:mitochondrial ribosomal subunit protein-domain-containing protein [Chaetomium fimeti]